MRNNKNNNTDKNNMAIAPGFHSPGGSSSMQLQVLIGGFTPSKKVAHFSGIRDPIEHNVSLDPA